VLMGVALVVAIELLGIRSLAFAVGSYLSIATTAAIFAGGMVRWLVERGSKEGQGGGEASPGALFSSGLIAAGGVFGLLAVALRVLADASVKLPPAFSFLAKLPDELAFGPKLLGSLAASNFFGMLMFVLLAASLFFFARKKLS
jgi:hypothetical protein